MIANVKPMIKYVTRYNKADTRRDIIIVDKDDITLSVTLFRDLAVNEGSMIEGNKHETTIIALSEFKISLYKGELCLTSQIASTILINPDIQLAKDMREWALSKEKIKTNGAPSRLFKNATKMNIGDIMQASQESSKAQYGSFIGKISNILNRHEAWYYSCTGCNKKVDKNIYDKCQNCQKNNEDSIPRYVVKIIVEDETDNARVTLFDAAETLIGCDAQKFMDDIKELLT
ncbi:replication protein A 70 kDa DNA-binding subunit B-like [Asparagus officinalis]|uniref:replication protein A 70 kDa DNA-binding subunit B-like n=1 Tax=Asparagus officinalis TaxID=4686 RepID=UPI00098E2C94|nr:replication protein A 70 kDa DNA-binding subunit B-like [Asparagus officinalis]